MELTYRGVRYQAPETTIDVEPTLEPEIYRGVRFQAKRVHYRVPKQGVQLTYRGAHYSA